MSDTVITNNSGAEYVLNKKYRLADGETATIPDEEVLASLEIFTQLHWANDVGGPDFTVTSAIDLTDFEANDFSTPQDATNLYPENLAPGVGPRFIRAGYRFGPRFGR